MMVKNGVEQEYFDWVCGFVCDNQYRKNLLYSRLLDYLYHKEFTYTISLDENRADDGVNLRYRFLKEQRYTTSRMKDSIDYRKCSVLEMMVALSIRCEESIMDEPELGNRTGQWFWNMIANLGLVSFIDDNFDIYQVENIVDCFLNRRYKTNGSGGLFTVNRPRRDLRGTEIWYQMMWYLDETLEEV